MIITAVKMPQRNYDMLGKVAIGKEAVLQLLRGTLGRIIREESGETDEEYTDVDVDQRRVPWENRTWTGFRIIDVKKNGENQLNEEESNIMKKCLETIIGEERALMQEMKRDESNGTETRL